MDASVIISRTCYTPKTLILFDLLVRNSLFAFTESVAELPADHLQVPHATSSGCTAPLGLNTPSISSHTSLRESTRSTNLLWMWKATLPHRRQSVCVLLRLLPNELVPLVIVTYVLGTGPC